MGNSKMIFNHEIGKADCRTQCIRDIVEFYGLKLSIPMSFGLGEGLGIDYWLERETKVPFMVLNGRKLQTEYNLCRNIGLKIMCFKEPDNAAAEEILKQRVLSGQPVMLDTDRYYLSYIGDRFGKTHFGHHSVIAADYRDKCFGLYDFLYPNMIWCPSTELAQARSSDWKPFTPQNKWYEFYSENIKLRLEYQDFAKSIKNVCSRMLSDNKNTGVSGIRTYVDEISSFEPLISESKMRHYLNLQINFLAAYIGQMDASGTMSRQIYAEFLDELGDMFDMPEYRKISEQLKDLAQNWKQIVSFLSSSNDLKEKLQFLRHQLLKMADLEAEFFLQLMKFAEDSVVLTA
ncbi:hypothetical protein CLHUN_04250 [Ruminiclostridium hungatei]|uniref:Butirosin biosynthesis protein H N-terminal domain-containing protein n=1 Tax=Ruminiclostridium hungatei TaxID=48256 RepID=A0A1V4SQ24_RUMHU|nr:BtrH N-terminal domain-containing protein [Ruminiclostridium hungatei]OPX45950.1 hypothetical protein CLHUN_04250 [Ruminiclostridium hungatei]